MINDDVVSRAPHYYDVVFSRQLDELKDIVKYANEIESILTGNCDQKLVGAREHPLDETRNVSIYKARMRAVHHLNDMICNIGLMMIDEVERQIGRHDGLVGPV